jgi:hypothetical protein
MKAETPLFSSNSRPRWVLRVPDRPEWNVMPPIPTLRLLMMVTAARTRPLTSPFQIFVVSDSAVTSVSLRTTGETEEE